MGLRIVNTFPGDVAAPSKPGQAIQFGLKSETLSAQPATLQVKLGLSNLAHDSVHKPDAVPAITSYGSVVFETPEHQRPVTATAATAILGGSNNLSITHGTNGDGEKSVYEIKVPINPAASVLAFVRLKTNYAWTRFNPNWCSANNTTGFYFGLEQGQYNSAAYMFLRDNGSGGSIVTGGPLQTYNAARPGQTEYALPWLTTIPDHSLLDLYIYFDFQNQQVQFWKKDPTDTTVPYVVLGTVPISTLGTFKAPSTNFDNVRTGVSSFATMYIGMAGRSGDVLEVVDYALYPDFRSAVLNGEATPDHSRLLLPDAPVTYLASNGLQPDNLNVGAWIPTGTAPNPTFYYQPGRRLVPFLTNINKTVIGVMGYQKKEPRVEPSAPVSSGDGFMIEGFIAGQDVVTAGVSTGMGIGVDDGVKSYHAVFLNNQNIKTIGLAKDPAFASIFDGYYVPIDGSSNTVPFDYTSLKLVRLVVDRRRSKILLFVDNSDVPVLTLPLSSTVPVSDTGYGRMVFGHLQPIVTEGNMQVRSLRYVPRYLAWETTDNLLPSDGTIDVAARYTYNSGDMTSVAQTATELTINKSVFNALGSGRYFTRAEPFSTVMGTQVDFKARVVSWTDQNGALGAPNTSVGAGIQIFTGVQQLYLGFYDAGLNGKVVGIVPGSGSASDIINQTALGRKFSVYHDWTQDTTYRLVYKAYDSIQLFIGPPVGDPILSIPWVNDTVGFDLPLDSTTAGLVFGAVETGPSSSTQWKYVRLGMSNGIEAAVTQTYPFGNKDYQFSARTLATVSFDES